MSEFKQQAFQRIAQIANKVKRWESTVSSKKQEVASASTASAGSGSSDPMKPPSFWGDITREDSEGECHNQAF